MEKQCFWKKGSDPPVCGVHNTRLVQEQLPDELIAEGLKGFTFFVCPLSGAVVNDETTPPERTIL